MSFQDTFDHTDYLTFLALLVFKLVIFDLFFFQRTVFEHPFIFLSITVGSILLLTSWIVMTNHPSRYRWMIVFNLFLSCLLFFNSLYLKHYYSLITFYDLAQIGQIPDVSSSVFKGFSFVSVAFFIDLFCYRWLRRFFSRFPRKESVSHYKSAGIYFCIGLVFIIINLLHVSMDEERMASFKERFSNHTVYQQVGFIGFYVENALRYVNENLPKREVQIAEEEKEEIDSWQNAQTISASPLSLEGIGEDYNLIVIQLESVQYPFTDGMINGEPLMPYLQELKKEMMRFNHFYSQVQNGGTSDAEFLLNTGTYPAREGVSMLRFSDNDYYSLIDILKEKGFDTNFFHAHDPSFWNRDEFYDALGVDHFYTNEDFQEGENIGWGLADKEFFEQTVDRLKEKEEPFYSFIATLTTHTPFEMPSSYREFDTGEYEDEEFGRYLHNLRYLDRSLEMFVEDLKKEGIWENSIVFMYGDHHSRVDYDKEDLQFIDQELSDLEYYLSSFRVPLYVSIPGEEGRDFNHITGQVDLFPTLLYLLGEHDEERAYTFGDNMFDEEDHFLSFFEGAYLDGETFYFPVTEENEKNWLCYDVLTGAVINEHACKEGYERSKKRLKYAEDILRGDLRFEE